MVVYACFHLTWFYMGNNPSWHVIAFKNVISMMVACQFVILSFIYPFLDIMARHKGYLYYNHCKMNSLPLECKHYQGWEFVLLITASSASRECPTHSRGGQHWTEGWTQMDRYRWKDGYGWMDIEGWITMDISMHLW